MKQSKNKFFCCKYGLWSENERFDFLGPLVVNPDRNAANL